MNCIVLLQKNLFLAAGLVIVDMLLVSAYYNALLSMLCQTSHVLRIVLGEHAAILQLCWQIMVPYSVRVGKFGTEGCMGTEISVQSGHARIKTHAM